MSLNLVSSANLDCARHATLALRQLASGVEFRAKVLQGVASYAAGCLEVEYGGASRLLAELMEDRGNRSVLLELGVVPAIVKMARSKKESPDVRQNSLVALAHTCTEGEGQLAVSKAEYVQSLLVEAALHCTGMERRAANLSLCLMGSHPDVELKAVKNWNSQSVRDKFKSMFLPDEPCIGELPPPTIAELDEVIAAAWEAEPRTAARTCYRIGILAQNPEHYEVLEQRGVIHLIAAMAALSSHEEVQLHAAVALKVLVESPKLVMLALQVAVSSLRKLALSKDAEVIECMLVILEKMKQHDKDGVLNDLRPPVPPSAG